MKKVLTSILLATLFVSAYAENYDFLLEEAADSTETVAQTGKKKKAKKQKAPKDSIKTGWNFGPLPAIGYSSDLGFHYGALCDIYNYGDGSKYPDYIYKFNVEVSAYTKGNIVLHSFFDSKYLIPGIRVSAAISWFANRTYSFYGFNGASSPYIKTLDKIWNDKANSKVDIPFDPEGTGFYLMQRDIFRVMTCFQGKFGNSNWGWAGGLSYWWLTTGNARNKKITAGTPSLYDLYCKYDIIPEHERKGGHHIELKAGIVYDTRDFENGPSKGRNLEVYFFGSPDFFGKWRNNYLKLAIHYRDFYTLGTPKLVFGYHLAYQGLIAGNAPFYMLQTIQSLNMKQINTEGLGSTCTLRGTIANRIQGNGYAWANFELRWKFVKFDWIKQHWTLALNPFFDMGAVVQPYRWEQMKDAYNRASTTRDYLTLPTEVTLSDGTVTDKLSERDVIGIAGGKGDLRTERLHMGAGVGLHVIMNENFNISFEFAKSIYGHKEDWKTQNDGVWGMNVGLNYIF